jgi:hypothetical protein
METILVVDDEPDVLAANGTGSWKPATGRRPFG